MKLTQKIVTLVLMAIPFAVSAQLGPIDTFFAETVNFINRILIPLVIGLALLMFVYGLYRWFILGGGNESDRAAGRQLALWSIIAFLLMTTVWAIVLLLSVGLFGVGGPGADAEGLPQGFEI